MEFLVVDINHVWQLHVTAGEDGSQTMYFIQCFLDLKIAPYSLSTVSVTVLVSELNPDICFFAKDIERDADNKSRNCLIIPLQR